MYRYIIVFFKMMSAQSSGVVLTFLVYTCMGERSEHKYGNMKKKLVMWLCYASMETWYQYMEIWQIFGNVTQVWKYDYLLEIWHMYGNMILASMEIWQFFVYMTQLGKYDIGRYGNLAIFWKCDTCVEIQFTLWENGKWFFFCLRNEAVTDGIWIANTQ